MAAHSLQGFYATRTSPALSIEKRRKYPYHILQYRHIHMATNTTTYPTTKPLAHPRTLTHPLTHPNTHFSIQTSTYPFRHSFNHPEALSSYTRFLKYQTCNKKNTRINP